MGVIHSLFGRQGWRIPVVLSAGRNLHGGHTDPLRISSHFQPKGGLDFQAVVIACPTRDEVGEAYITGIQLGSQE